MHLVSHNAHLLIFSLFRLSNAPVDVWGAVWITVVSEL